MWRVMYADFEHPRMWLAFEFEGESYWDTREEATRAMRSCSGYAAHVVYEVTSCCA